MKKLFTAILLCLLTLTCAFAFTACGGNQGGGGDEEKPNDTAAVTEAEWEKAFGIFDEENYEDANVTVKCSAIEGRLNYSYVFDYQNKKLHYTYYLSTEGEADDEIEYYYWQGNEFSYLYKKYTKGDAVDESKVYTDFDTNFKTYLAGLGETISSYGLKEKYNEVTFDEEKQEYSAHLQYGAPLDTECNMTLKFLNGKLNKWVTEYEDDGVFEVITMEYAYGETVTIPQNVLDMPVVGQ